MKTDLIDILEAVREERLAELDIEWSDDACACVVMASGGYPAAYKKGMEIRGLHADGQVRGVTVYHAGTKYEGGRFYTNGGRVLGVTATADTLEEALKKAYAAVAEIDFDNAHYRKDIGAVQG